MIYTVVRFQRRTQDAECSMIGEFESLAQAYVHVHCQTHEERDGHPFVTKQEFGQNSVDGFFIFETETSIPQFDLFNFVLNNKGTYLEYV